MIELLTLIATLAAPAAAREPCYLRTSSGDACLVFKIRRHGRRHHRQTKSKPAAAISAMAAAPDNFSARWPWNPLQPVPLDRVAAIPAAPAGVGSPPSPLNATPELFAQSPPPSSRIDPALLALLFGLGFMALGAAIVTTSKKE